MLSALEKAANDVADEVAGEPKEGLVGFDWMTIATIVAQVVIEIVKNCKSRNPEEVAATMKNPGIMARARFRAIVSRATDNTGSQTIDLHKGRLAHACMSVASRMTEADLVSVIHDANDNSLI
jgi:hypothetical protein